MVSKIFSWTIFYNNIYKDRFSCHFDFFNRLICHDFVFKTLAKLKLQIPTFVNYYHSCKLVHRSFKLDDTNVPINKDNTLLLISFSLKNIGIKKKLKLALKKKNLSYFPTPRNKDLKIGGCFPRSACQDFFL